MLETLKVLLSAPATPSDVLHKIEPICQQLSEGAAQTDMAGVWPENNVQLFADSNVFRWFVPSEFDGLGWNEQEILVGYLGLSQACLTSAFILTQWNAACKRILTSDNHSLRDRLAAKLASGEVFATVGISHLSTSRQHYAKPALRAARFRDGFQLNGMTPWVTGADAADVLVLGATLDSGEQILAAVPGNAEGMTKHPGMKLVALSSSCTDRVELDDVYVSDSNIISGPVHNVMHASSGSGGGTGGLHTSTLAIGLSIRAIDYLSQEANDRPEIGAIARKFHSDAAQLLNELIGFTEERTTMSMVELRRRANSLVLRSTQAALQAAKGAGFVAGHPVGRWAKEGLFFLVWSCPQAVVEANLCELAGLD